MLSDADLVERSRRRDADAFASLVERHQKLVFGVAFAKCRDAVLAEDVAQDAFVVAWRDLDRLRNAERVGSWVAGIARNLATTAARQRARNAELTEIVHARTPEDEALDREERELLQEALEDVPDAHREALVLYYIEGQSIAHIARGLAIREDLVKQRLSRGRNALRASVAARVESALGRMRPRAGFGVGVVAAIAAIDRSEAVAATTAAGKVTTMISIKHIGAAIAAIAVATGATLVAMRTTSNANERGDSHRASSQLPSSTTATPRTKGLNPRKLANPSRREDLLAQIRAANSRRVTAPAPATATTSPNASPAYGFAVEYLQELAPLLRDCFTSAADRTPALAIGQIVVEFTIEGVEGIGGVVTESTVDSADSNLADETLQECVRDTMYALEVDPPPGGVKHVRIPIKLQGRDE